MGSRLSTPGLGGRRTVTVKGSGLPEVLGQPALTVVRVTGREGLCDLFEYDLELKTADDRNVVFGPGGNVDKEALEGRELTIEIELDGVGTGLTGGLGAGKREITGLVTRIVGPIPEGRHFVYRFVLRPWLWLATLTKDYKIYQQKTVIEILDELLADYSFPAEKRLSLVQYPTREFQVQYGETDFDFFQRLTQEWGIGWFFEHSDGHHRLVLTDGNGAFRRFTSDAYHTIKWYSSADRVDEEHISDFTVVDQLVTGKWRTNDYDFVKPRADLTVKTHQPRETGHRDQEVYEWPGDHAQAATGNDPWQDGHMVARIRMEELRQHGLRAYGRGNLRGVVPGCTFTLARYPEDKANCEYLIFATTLRLEDVPEEAGQRQQWRCEVEFEVQPTSETFRPNRTQPKPRTTGPQTATVVGPEAQELWTDEYARVKVHMHWDMYGQRNENSSCWVRAASPWHGDQYGAIQIPRVGQEVIVDFLHGDPDLPLIVGRVPNQLNMPPWNLPGQQALSGFRSKEIGGGRHNHLVMDDTQGQIQSQLSSDYLLSQLSIGHITRIPDSGGRKDKRGEGAELRTDGHMALRSAKGTLLSTEGRQNARGHALDMRETIARLKEALSIAETLHEASSSVQAQVDEQKGVADAIQVQNDAIKGSGEALGELTSPHVVVSSAAGIAATAEESTHLHSKQHTSLTTGKHLSFNVGKSFLASAKEMVSICAHKLGIKLFASRGPVDIQAQNDSMNLLAKLGISIVSTEDSIRIIAKKELLIGGGGSHTRYNAGGITHLTDGKYIAHAATHAWPTEQSLPIEMPLTPKPICIECLLNAMKTGSALAAV